MGDRLQTLTRIGAMALVVSLSLTGGYMFVPHQLRTALVALALAMLWCLSAAFGARRSAWRFGSVEWALVAFVVWSIVATVTGVYLHAGLAMVIQMLGYVVFLMLWSDLFADERWRRWGWAAVAASGAIAGFFGLRDWAQTALFQGELNWRAFGTFYNPNCLAGFLLTALPAGVVMLVMAWRRATDPERPERPRFELIVAGFALLIPAITIFLTASRAGLLGAMLAGFVLAIAAPTRIRRRSLLIAALALVALVIVAPPLRNRMLSLATQSHSAIFRWYTWQGTASMIAARPLTGFGPGTFEHSYQQYAQTGFTRMAHQTPLQVAAEAGLPALIALLAAVALMIRQLVVGLHNGGERALQIAAGLAALAGLGLQNLADYTWHVPAVGLLMAAIAGLSRAAALPTADDQPRPRVRAGWWAGALACLALVVVCSVGLRAQSLAATGRAALARGNYHVASGWLGQATGVDPLDADVLDDLAQALAGHRTPDAIRSAVQVRRRVAELSPLDSGNYLGMAWLLSVQGDADGAAAAARRAVDTSPNHPRGYATLAHMLIQAGREDEALDVYRRLEEVYHSPVGKYQAVEEVMDFAYAEAWLALGREALGSGDAAGAEAYFEDAAELAAEFASLQRAREKALRQIGSWDEEKVARAERLVAEAHLALRDARNGRQE